MREQLECMKHCFGMYNEPADSVWVRIRDRSAWVTLWWVATRDHLIRKEK